MSAETQAIEKVTVICWDASFRENFDALACALDQTLPAERRELIFVEFYEQANAQVRAMLEGREGARIVALGNRYPGRENEHLIGACINEGIRRARGDLIVVPDADVLFERDFLEEVVRQHEACPDLALYFYRIDQPPAGPPVERTVEAIRAVGSIRSADNYGGCLSVRKQWLETINGYEESDVWRGYSSVDQDTARRLKALGLCIKWHPTKFLYHGRHPGTSKPDAASLRRIMLQRAIFNGRARALETLPDRGLDPARRPRWTYRPAPDNRPGGLYGTLKDALYVAVRMLVPYGVRRRIVKLFSG